MNTLHLEPPSPLDILIMRLAEHATARYLLL